MTTYTAIPNGDIDADSPLTTGLVNLLRDNPVAMTEGSAGAPKIQAAAMDTDSVVQDAIAANVVGQSEIKTATSQLSKSITGGSTNFLSPTGGTYSLHVYMGGNSFSCYGAAGTYHTLYGMKNESGGTLTAYINSIYINASPPYNLGDGDIPLFIYLLINSAGDVVGSSIAPDPHWAYHGPTNIAGKIIEGKGVARIPQWMAEGFDFQTEIKSGISGRINAAIQRLKASQMVTVVADNAFKNRDMNIVPHPFGVIAPGETVVLLDPVSNFVADLAMYKAARDLMPEPDPAGDIFKLIESGFITFDNAALPRTTPAGVIAVNAGWK